MTELELYKFINENDIEWHRENNNDEIDVIIMPNFYHISDFCKLVKSLLDDDVIDCKMKDGYFCFWMKYICDFYGIEMDNVFITP